MIEGDAADRRGPEQKYIHTLLNDYILLCLKLFPNIPAKKNILKDLPEVTGNKIIHNDKTYYKRTDIQGNVTSAILFTNSNFFLNQTPN